MNLRALFIGGAAALLLSHTAAIAAEYVVLDSNAAGIEPGVVVDDDAQMTIPEGATVVIVNPKGQTEVVNGPFTGKLSDARTNSSESLSETLDRLTKTRGQDTKVLGAVRSAQVEGGSLTE